MEFKDYYSTLGVAKTASEKDIKQAFRKLARKHHPDVNPGDAAAETRFKEINEAYEVLGDADKRRKYDELGANWRMYEQAGTPPPGGSGGWNVNVGGSPGGGYRTMTEDEMREMFGDGDPFSSFFHQFFGGAGGGAGTTAGTENPRGRGRGGRARPRQGRDLEHELTLSLDDVRQPAQRRFVLHQGGVETPVDVRIPAGVADGARLRVTGKGEMGAGGAPAGNLYLRIRIEPHPVFERKGADLYTRLAVPLTVAVLGGEADVATLGGGSKRVKIPATTQNGRVFRLRGQGLPVVGKPDQVGDLYATVDVQLPTSLSDAEREHFEALRQLAAV